MQGFFLNYCIFFHTTSKGLPEHRTIPVFLIFVIEEVVIILIIRKNIGIVK